MNKNESNFSNAKLKSDYIDNEIIKAVQKKCNFRVEAGAGSGKTYSLKKVIDWLRDNQSSNALDNKKVACITYTNAAVDVIAERLGKDSFIVPSTIHTFAWNSIKQYQQSLLSSIEGLVNFNSPIGLSEIKEVTYTLGHRYVKDNILYLGHDDVLTLFCLLLDNEKFRRLFSGRYSLILIDEYQDTYRPIIDKFLNYFIETNSGPRFGFFGDSWQTIYQSNNACGYIKNTEQIEEIKKPANFRSAPKIVRFLNNIRPDLPQDSAIDGFEGEVSVVSCNDYEGERRKEVYFKDDLPIEEISDLLYGIESLLKRKASEGETVKILMITHKVLARQQGYNNLLDILGDSFRNQEDSFLLFFMNIVEPIYGALKNQDAVAVSDILGSGRQLVLLKSDKFEWLRLFEQLREARSRCVSDVVDVLLATSLIPCPSEIERDVARYRKNPNDIYRNDKSLRQLFDLRYSEFISAIGFLRPESIFSTEHGVKGEEYDNVVFVIGKGWNQYQFEKYLPMAYGKDSLSAKEMKSYERNRNLFYVCCSRPKKRLVLFVTIPLEGDFLNFLKSKISSENIFTYREYCIYNNL